MSEEEKKAIEYIKNCLDNEYNFKNATRQKDKKAYNIILNLIEKQQKELDKKDKKLASQEKEIKQLKEDISNMYDEKVVRNILEDECGMSKYEIDEILN